MKFSLNPITAHKVANLQNTVKRLIIILLSLFFLLIIRASIWSPYGKNLAEPRYDQKDDHFAKFCHTPLNHRFHLVIWCLSSERHFGAVSVKFSLNRITAQKMTNLQNTVRRLIIIVLSLSYDAYHQSVTLSSYGKNVAKAHYDQKDSRFPKFCHTPLNYPFHLVI